MGSDGKTTEGTLKGYEPFMPEYIDCEILHKTFKGFGRNDTKTIVEVLSARSNAQRLQLLYYYKKKFDKDLYEQLKGAAMGDFWRLIQAMMMNPTEYDARELNRALKGLGTDDNCLMEILATRSNKEIKSICDKYKELFHAHLWQDITKEVGGELRHLLVDLVKAERKEYEQVNDGKAVEVAMELAGVPLLGENSHLRKLLIEENQAQLTLILREYESISGRTVEQELDAAQEKVQKEYKTALKVLVKVAENKQAYFAEQLHYSMKGLGTKDKTLIRLVVTRCEIDMVQIKEEFLQKYHQTLVEYIMDDTSGDYRKMLLFLIGAKQHEQ